MSSAKWRPFCLGLNVLTKKARYPRVITKHHYCRLLPNTAPVLTHETAHQDTLNTKTSGGNPTQQTWNILAQFS